MARNKIASKGALVENGDYVGATFQFANGETYTVFVDDLPTTIQRRLTIHGLLQKIGDSYSGITNVTEAIAAAEATINALSHGDWSTRGEVGGMLLDALIEYFKGQKSEDDIRARFAKMSPEEKTALKKHPKIKVIMARLTVERAERLAEDAEDLEI